MRLLLGVLWTLGSVAAIYILVYDLEYYGLGYLISFGKSAEDASVEGITKSAPDTPPIIIPPSLIHSTNNRHLYVGYTFDLYSNYQGPDSRYLSGGCYENSSTNLIVAFDDVLQVTMNERTHIIGWDIVESDELHGVIIAAVLEDTNDDGRLTCDDAGSLIYFDLETRQPQILQTGYDFSDSDLITYENGFFSIDSVQARLFDGDTEMESTSSSEFFGYDAESRSMTKRPRLKFDPRMVTSVPVIIDITSVSEAEISDN